MQSKEITINNSGKVRYSRGIYSPNLGSKIKLGAILTIRSGTRNNPPEAIGRDYRQEHSQRMSAIKPTCPYDAMGCEVSAVCSTKLIVV